MKQPHADARPWIYLSIVFAVLAAAAFVLLWGGGPMFAGGIGSASMYSHKYWDLPSFLGVAAFFTMPVAPLAGLFCAAFALDKRYPNASGGAWVFGAFFLIALLMLIF